MERIYAISLLSSVILAGCSVNDFESVNEGNVVSLGMITRSGETTEWSESDKLIIEDITTETVTTHNFLFSSGSWNKSEEDKSELKWPDEGNLKINAFLSKKGAESNKISLSSAVTSDETVINTEENSGQTVVDYTMDDNMDACDFLYYTGDVSKGNTLDFTLYHVMSQLNINATFTNLPEGSTGISELIFEMPDGLSRIDCNSSWTPSSDKVTVKANIGTLSENSQEIKAYVIPGDFNNTISFRINGSEKDFYAQASGLKLEANKVYSVPMTIDCSNGKVSIKIGAVSVNEWNVSEQISGLTKVEDKEIVAPWDGTSATEFGGGEGTSDNPYMINNPQQLAYYRDLINKRDLINISGKYFKLGNDLDLNNIEWMPIAPNSEYQNSSHFDGNGKIISNLKITNSKASESTHTGLFGFIKNGSINNLTIEDANILATSCKKDGAYTGILVGQYLSSKKLSNCHVKNSRITVDDGYLGGMVGQCHSSVIACSVVDTEFVSLKSEESHEIGGLIGFIRVVEGDLLDMCYVHNLRITAPDKSTISGLICTNGGKPATENPTNHLNSYVSEIKIVSGAGLKIANVIANNPNTDMVVKDCYSDNDYRAAIITTTKRTITIDGNILPAADDEKNKCKRLDDSILNITSSSGFKFVKNDIDGEEPYRVVPAGE